MASFSTELFEELPIVGILRGLPDRSLRPVIEAVLGGGLTNLEITMNTPRAAEQIQAACAIAGDRLNIGAGTVTHLQVLWEARKAGASFIVTPTAAPAVVECCRVEKIPVFPGALSPTEIQEAWQLGATMVKVFPADALGPDGFRGLAESMPQVRLMSTGGVDVKTLGAYAHAGASAFGVGSPLFRAERIAAEDWGWIREQCGALVMAYREALK